MRGENSGFEFRRLRNVEFDERGYYEVDRHPIAARVLNTFLYMGCRLLHVNCPNDMIERR